MRLLFPALLLSLLVPAPAQAPLQPVLPDLSTSQGLGADLFANSGAVGTVVVIVRDNQTFFQGYGETAPGSHTVPTADSVVRLCSLTKIFTTDVLAKLVKQQVVRLDDPLQRYAPKGALVPRRAQPITLEELATHTSGLPRELGARPRKIPPFAYPDFNTRWQWLARQSLVSVPGSAALYSNIGFDLLSDALEAAAQKPYAALLAEQTLNPLGMRQTTYYPNQIQCDRLLRPSHSEPCAVTEPTEGSAGLYSTPADMALWLKYLLGTGSPSLPAQDPTAQAVYLDPTRLIKQVGLDHAGRPTGIGLGWMHLPPAGDPTHIIEKTGGGAGFSSYIAMIPARHIALFFAFAEGPSGWKQNVFIEANNILLTLAGLPPLPDEPAKPKSRHRSKPRPKHPRSPAPTSPAHAS